MQRPPRIESGNVKDGTAQDLMRFQSTNADGNED